MSKPNQKRRYEKVITPTGRASFVNLFHSKQPQGSNKFIWGLMLIFNKEAQASEQFKAMKKTVGTLMSENHGPDPKKWGEWKNPLKSADTYKAGKLLSYEGVSPGDIIIQINKTDKRDEKAPTEPPQAIVNNRVITAAEARQFYSGCYAQASVAAGYFEAAGNYGVHFILNGVLKIKDGEPLGGSSGDVFSDFGITPSQVLAGSDNAGASEQEDYGF